MDLTDKNALDPNHPPVFGLLSRLTFHSRKMKASENGDTLNEADIIKRITHNFSLQKDTLTKTGGDAGIGAAHAETFNEEKLVVVKSLFRQLIDNKIEKQLNDIEQRKQLFTEKFAVEFYRKATIKAA